MTTLLHIEASPRGERSYSSRAANAFLTAYQRTHPSDKVQRLNLFEADLPTFDGFTIQAKYNIMHGMAHSDEQLDAWKKVEEIIREFKAADRYLFSLGMWNFGIPYRLKQYFDIIVQPTYTFEVTPQGAYNGLVTGKKACTIFARGGSYPMGTPGAAYDMQSPYLNLILNFMGITDITTLFIEPTLSGDAPGTLRLATEKAMELAAGF